MPIKKTKLLQPYIQSIYIPRFVKGLFSLKQQPASLHLLSLYRQNPELSLLPISKPWYFKIKPAILFLLVLFLFISLTTSFVYAKRVLPKASGSLPSTASGVSTSKTQGVTVSIKFRSDRQAINATFSNLRIATKVEYVLSYDTNGTTQGATGTLLPSAPDPTVREIIFGTCSKGVCRYDSGITNAKFTSTTTLPNGKKVVKSFRLKV